MEIIGRVFIGEVCVAIFKPNANPFVRFCVCLDFDVDFLKFWKMNIFGYCVEQGLMGGRDPATARDT